MKTIPNRWALHVATPVACMVLAACSGMPGSERALNEQAAWASSMGKGRTESPQANQAVRSDTGTVRLVAGGMGPAPPPPTVATLTPPPPPRAPAPVVQAAAAPPAPPPVAVPAAASAGQSAAEPESERKAVMLALLAWRKAWAEGDATVYMGHYDAGFKSDLPNRAAWEKQRRERLANRRINIQIENIAVRVIDGLARAEFTQRYTSDKHVDLGNKSMELRKVAGKWLIVNEQWRKG